MKLKRAGGWQLGVGIDLQGKTLALLGLGKIGQVGLCREAAKETSPGL